MASTSTPDVVIRAYRPADDVAVKALFARGMQDTIVAGMRSLAWRNPRVYILLGGMYGVGYLARGHALGGIAAAALASAIHWVLPWHVVNPYVTYCLQADLKDIPAHYSACADKVYFVATFASDDSVVVGTVAVDRVTAETLPEHGFSWEVGDAELRRMSVAPVARGRGVGKLLLQAAKDFADTHGYHRLVLSTSGAQAVARKLYTTNGFVQVFTAEYLPLRLLPVYFYAFKFHNKNELN